MRMQFSPSRTMSTTKSQGANEDLLVLLVRLLRHPGFLREEIVSEKLKRYFPKSQGFDRSSEEILRRKFAESDIDTKTVTYLIDKRGYGASYGSRTNSRLTL